MLPRIILASALLLVASSGLVAGNARRMTAIRSSTAVASARLGEQFKLFPGESASIEDTDLSLKLRSVLRSWYAKGNGHSVDVKFVSILKGAEQQHSLRMGKQSKIVVGAYQIELVAANPFGRNDCDFKVMRLP